MFLALLLNWKFHSQNETKYKILEYLDLRSLYRLSCTNRQFRTLTRDSLFYKSLNLRPYWHCFNANALLSLVQRCARLRKLDLSWCGNHGILTTNHLKEFLNQCGSCLTHLRLNCCDIVDDSVIFHLSMRCKDLRGTYVNTNRKLNLSVIIVIYLYLFIYVRMCVCVCVYLDCRIVLAELPKNTETRIRVPSDSQASRNLRSIQDLYRNDRIVQDITVQSTAASLERSRRIGISQRGWDRERTGQFMLTVGERGFLESDVAHVTRYQCSHTVQESAGSRLQLVVRIAICLDIISLTELCALNFFTYVVFFFLQRHHTHSKRKFL